MWVQVYGACVCYATQDLCSARGGPYRESVSGEGVLGVYMCGCVGEFVGWLMAGSCRW